MQPQKPALEVDTVTKRKREIFFRLQQFFPVAVRKAEILARVPCDGFFKTKRFAVSVRSFVRSFGEKKNCKRMGAKEQCPRPKLPKLSQQGICTATI